MRKLGVPAVPPWYPALKIPINLIESVIFQLPGGRRRGAELGDRRQARLMRTMIPDKAAIGHSAQHVAH
ncbi:hypothetical protein TSST111916_20820 [Tsukamurella strandjordii]